MKMENFKKVTKATEKYTLKIPGKAIICGGYLVLNQQNKAISISPSCYSTVTIDGSLIGGNLIEIVTNFEDRGIFNFNSLTNTYIYQKTGKKFPSMIYCETILNMCLRLLKNSNAIHNMVIKIELNKFLFSEINKDIESSIKTGLGSSCVFIIAIAHAFYTNSKNDTNFYDFCMNVNKMVSPKSSGCDISSVIHGNVIYQQNKAHFRLNFSGFSLILGSFNKDTSTRYMIDAFLEVKDEKWKVLAEINHKIITAIDNTIFQTDLLKKYFFEYLETLNQISSSIVPIKQYKILQDTFKYDILGCGVSGSGGEDCVWCLVKDENAAIIEDFWKKEFIYVAKYSDLNGKLEIE